MIIQNGKNTPLNANTGTLPYVGDALLNWFQPMVFGVVTKTVENFQAVETQQQLSFQGVWQPYSDRQLSLKSEGERKWSWYTCHSDPSLSLEPDMVIVYLGVQYRVMSQKDYRLYGYLEYHLIQDYTGAGPEVQSP